MKNWIKMQVTDRQIELGVYKWDFKCRYRLADMLADIVCMQILAERYKSTNGNRYT